MKKLLQQAARPELLLYFILISVVAFGNGLSDSVFANYFREAYNADALQRGFIELPRELPGMLCVLVIALLGFLCDIRIAVIAQVCSFVGLTVLGLLTPPFAVMLVFLFISSMGLHLFMPLQDAIGMQLAEEGQVGRRMGQYSSVRAGVGFFAGIIVFVGFRTGLFSFQTPIKTVFLVGAAAFACAIAVSAVMAARIKPAGQPRRRFRFVFKKKYKYYYIVTVLQGAQKQIAIVYGTWVIVSMLSKGADTLALLYIASGFVSMFFMRALGHWMDRFGIRPMMFLDALTFIGVYVVYGLLVWGVAGGVLPKEGWAVWLIYIVFILDRLSMQVGVVKSFYLRSIAESEEDITATLSMGITLDHVVSIAAALIGGVVWTTLGSQWVFFGAAFLSFGNLYVAWRIKPQAKPLVPAQGEACTGE